MGVASGAKYFRPTHTIGVVRAVNNAILADGLEEAGPPASAGKLCIRPEKYVAAYGAIISPFYILVPVFAGERLLGRLLPGRGVYGGGEYFFPLRVGHVEVCSIGVGIIWVVLRVYGGKAKRQYRREEDKSFHARQLLSLFLKTFLNFSNSGCITRVQ